jgi:hypothetical protein
MAVQGVGRRGFDLQTPSRKTLIRVLYALLLRAPFPRAWTGCLGRLALVGAVEREIVGHSRRLPPAEGTIKLRVRRRTPWREIWEVMFRKYRKRSILGFTWGYCGAATLMVAAAIEELVNWVAAERQSLESITAALTSAAEEYSHQC